MKWETEYWGPIITAENNKDNNIIDALVASLTADPVNCYEVGKIDIETENGLRSITFYR